MGNGGGSATLRISTVQSCSSMLARGQAVVGAVRRAGGDNVPVTLQRRTPARTSTELSTTHWVDAGVVAEVDERQLLAVLAAGGDPAAQADRLADVLGAQFAALVGAHGGAWS